MRHFYDCDHERILIAGELNQEQSRNLLSNDQVMPISAELAQSMASAAQVMIELSPSAFIKRFKEVNGHESHNQST